MSWIQLGDEVITSSGKPYVIAEIGNLGLLVETTIYRQTGRKGGHC